MVHHHQSAGESRDRRMKGKLIKSCDIYLVLILSSQALQGEVCCLGSVMKPTEKSNNFTSTLKTNDPVVSSKNHQDIKKMLHLNTTTSTLQVPPANISTATRKTLADIRRKIMRRRKDTDDMNTMPFPFPLVEDMNVGELSTTSTTAADGGGLLYGDDYLEDGLEFAETPPDASSQSANGHPPTETGNFTSNSEFINSSNDIDIERLVRSQVNMAATNFATLRPDEYQAPTFNDTIQGLDLNSYLSNFTDPRPQQQELDHTIPEESATVKVKHHLEDSNLFYPNHNYKYDQDTSASPFKSSKLVELRKTVSTTIDPLTASSDESNKYGSIPRATEQYVPTTSGPLLRPVDDLRNYPNKVQHVLKYAPIMRSSSRNNHQLTVGNASPIKKSQRDDKMNQFVLDRQQEQTQIDRPATVESPKKDETTNSSDNLSKTNVHGSSLDQKLSSKGFTDDQLAVRDYLAANQQHQLGFPTSNVQRLPYSRTGFKNVNPHLLYGIMNDKLQTIESQRVQPSLPPASATLKPVKRFRRPYKITISNHDKLLAPLAYATHANLSQLNINGSLAARLLVNRYKNWPLKFANLTGGIDTTTTTTTSTTPKQMILDSNLQKLLHAHYGLEVPPFVPISPLAKLHSSADIQAPKIFPWHQPTATTTTPSSSNTRPTISLQSFTKATTPMMMMSSIGGKTPPIVVSTPASASEVMLRSGSLKTNSTKPLGARANLRRAPAHHHHHHSHVHSIKPSLISIPIPLSAKYHHAPASNYYDSLLAAADAAAASAAHSHKLSRGQQVLAQTLLSQSHPGVPVRLPHKKYQHRPPGTIPIGGTLASTRGHPTSSITKTLHQHQKPGGTSTGTNGNGNSDNLITTTYQSGLLAHLLETANRALKQVAGNTASLLNLQGSSSSHNQLLEVSTQAPPTSTTQRGSEFSANDYFEPLESQLHTIGLYQAPTDDSSPLSAYLAALLSSTGDLYNQQNSKFKDIVEPLALASPNILDWTDFNNQSSDSNEVMLASLGDNSNLLYPVLAHSSPSNSESGHGLTKSALASLLDSDDQTENSNPVRDFDSPRHQYWSKPLLSPPPPGQRIIPLKQSASNSSSNNNNKTLVATAQSSSKFKSNYQEEDLENSSHHYPAPASGVKKGSQKDGESGAGGGSNQQMPYAVAHYIGESPPLGQPKSPDGTRGGESMVYSLIEPEFIHSTNGFIPMTHHHHKRPIRGSGLLKTGELVLSSANANGANPLDNLSHQPHVYSFSDHPFGASKTTLTGNESKKSNSIKSLMGSGSASDDYRANESKGEEHYVSIMPESSLNPNNKHPDPLELLLHLTSGGLKPHLMAASDIVNYHKLKLIHHYLQHHVHGHDHMSEAARLAVGGHSPKAQLMLAFWPIIIAIIPIMIIVAIVVQLVLAAPLVLFAMTTLTVARFVTSVFGPMFSREDVSSFSVKSVTSPRPKLAAVPSNNFLYTMLKMETRPPRYIKTTTTTTTTSSPSSTTSTSTTSKPQRRRRRRRHLLSEDHFKSNDLEDYFESLLL